jgi:hypothetical protein
MVNLPVGLAERTWEAGNRSNGRVTKWLIEIKHAIRHLALSASI